VVSGSPLPYLLAFVLLTLVGIVFYYFRQKRRYAVSQINTLAAKLRAAEEQLRKAEHEKDEFLSMLGHDLRNPLSSIAGAIHLLRSRSNYDEVQKRAIELADKQIRHMNRLIGDVLDISQIRHGKLQIALERVDVTALVKQTTEDCCNGLKKNLTVTLQSPETPIYVEGDRRRVAQMLSNLIQNAVRFTDPGGHITVRVGVDNTASHVYVSVLDTGIGIEPRVLPSILTLDTHTNHNAWTRGEGGLGLGLAMVRALTELHGGTVSAFSAGKGKGAEFKFTLPLAVPSLSALVAKETTVLAAKRATQRG